jgi:hypothetical protein
VLLGDIARAHGAALRQRYALTPEQHAVLRAVERCRTAALGGHKHVCDRCGHTVPMYNSCRNRHCPTCQSLAQHQWIERRRETILPVPYFHLVFTLPSELRPVVAMNRERLFALMFEAASRTLLMLSRDKKRLGGTPAVTMVLHTWTRELTFHPHVHAIVSAGALSDEGEWIESKKHCLFPVKVMARLFRRLFRAALLKAVEAEQVRVRPDHVAPMRKALFETKWIAYAKAPFGGAEQVYGYLGRYTHRVGNSNARILRQGDQRVDFATKNGRTCSLHPVEFLRRFLLHVLPRGFHKLRHYSLCSTHHVAAGTLGKLRAILLPRPAAPAEQQPSARTAEAAGAAASVVHARAPESWLDCLLVLTGIDALRCPQCSDGRLMRRPLDEHALLARRDTS